MHILKYTILLHFICIQSPSFVLQLWGKNIHWRIYGHSEFYEKHRNPIQTRWNTANMNIKCGWRQKHKAMCPVSWHPAAKPPHTHTHTHTLIWLYETIQKCHCHVTKPQLSNTCLALLLHEPKHVTACFVFPLQSWHRIKIGPRHDVESSSLLASLSFYPCLSASPPFLNATW